MANSPTLCQKFVAAALSRIRRDYPTVYLCHYMDDILIAASQEGILLRAFADLEQDLGKQGLIIAPEKVQRHPPFAYLGFHLQPDLFSCQKVSLRVDDLHTLNDFQKLLGDINWIRPYLGLTTGELRPLFDILRGDSDPSSARQLTQAGRAALQKVETAIKSQQATFCDYSRPWYACILATTHSPTDVLWQDRPLRWVHLPSSPARVLTPYYEHVAILIQHAREESCRYFGREPAAILVPYSQAQINWLFQKCTPWGIALAEFPGQVDNHYPPDKLLQFCLRHSVIFPKIVTNQPLPGAETMFTDGSSSGTAAYVYEQQIVKWTTPYSSAQEIELATVCRVLVDFAHKPINILSDSHYVV